MLDLFALVVALLFLSNDPLREAKELTRNRAYQDSLKLLEKTKPGQHYVDYCFYMAVNQFSLNNKKETERWLRLLEDNWEPLPKRYEVVAALMRDDMKHWKQEATDLGDISREMKKVQDRLQNAKAGQHTQKMQKEIVDRLSKLIEQKEDQLKKQQEAQNMQQQQEQEKQADGGQNAKNPMNDSKIANDSGPGTVDPVKVRRLSESWGRLPERERARQLQEITRGMPARHREAIENYFRNLARAQQKK